MRIGVSVSRGNTASRHSRNRLKRKSVVARMASPVRSSLCTKTGPLSRMVVVESVGRLKVGRVASVGGQGSGAARVAGSQRAASVARRVDRMRSAELFQAANGHLRLRSTCELNRASASVDVDVGVDTSVVHVLVRFVTLTGVHQLSIASASYAQSVSNSAALVLRSCSLK